MDTLTNSVEPDVQWRIETWFEGLLKSPLRQNYLIFMENFQKNQEK